MVEKTDIEAIRDIVRTFLYLDIEETSIPFIVSHPIFTMSSVFVRGVEKPLNLYDKEDLKIVHEYYLNIISKANLYTLYSIIRMPYKLTFLKYAMDSMSLTDFSHYLADAWITTENPNQDVNCSISFIVDMFKKADKKALMTPEDYEVFLSLPEKIIVYRGVAVGRNPYGISWTDDLDMATWFSNRFNRKEKTGYIQKAIVDKENVLAYFNTRNEKELVCNIPKAQIERL